MKCEGIYEAEVLNPNGEIVEFFRGKNIVNYGFIGGLFKHIFGIGNTNASLETSDVSKVPYTEKAQFNYLYLFGSSTDPTASQTDVISTYTPGSDSEKDLTSENDGITYSSVVFDTNAKKITMTIQVTYGPNQAVNGGSQYTWNSMGVASMDISGTPKLLSRVKMGNGITKTNSQTLRVRYNFSIVVT